MSTTMTDELRAQIAGLSRADKVALATELWDEVGDDIPDAPVSLPPELIEELDRRRAKHEANPETGLTLDELQARWDARYGRN